MRARDFIVDNMDHDKDDQAVPQLKAALLAQKTKLQSATDDQVYDIIDKMMTRIAKAHSISGQKLHDMWVKQYKQIPDTWIMKESHTLEERRKKNRKPRRAAYGPGLYGGYGYFSNYGNSDSGDAGGGDGGGESVEYENFADGKNPQDKGDAKRHGVNTKASVSSLRKTAKQGGRKGQLAHWLANMKAGRAKNK